MTAARAFDPGTVLVTGGSGFIGSTLVRRLLAESPTRRVVNLDALTYAASSVTLADTADAHGAEGDGRYCFVHGDVRDRALVSRLLAGTADEPGSGRRVCPVDAVLHLAADTHVDRAILNPAGVVDTSVQGALAMLECTRLELARAPRDFRFVQVSTDEVYGSLDVGDAPVSEDATLRPNNPYAAGKAAADLLVRGYARTFNLPALITRASNTYGPYQFPEKLIPLFVLRALHDEPLPIFGDGSNRRSWIHATDHAAAIWAVCTRGNPDRQIYNVCGNVELTNLEVARRVLSCLGKPESLIRFVTDRAAHDRRYAVDDGALRTELRWSPMQDFDAGLEETVRWYVERGDWWGSLRAEAYHTTEALYLRDDGVR